ncbi:MAG: hypothetical protein GX121_07705, partial [Ignavibacteria bacterium]|nr:hypothetical protein [Ignavibacteria bacterium]
MKKNLTLLIIAIMLCFSANLFSQIATPPANGDGTTANPYQIASLENLYWIAEDALNWDKNYIQTANINAAETYTWFDAEGWVSIGNNSTKFTGTYNGQNFTIDSLRINRTASYRGFFGYIENSTIENLSLTNVNILGGQYTGGLVGYSASSNIERVNVTGNVSSSSSYAGG